MTLLLVGCAALVGGCRDRQAAGYGPDGEPNAIAAEPDSRGVFTAAQLSQGPCVTASNKVIVAQTSNWLAETPSRSTQVCAGALPEDGSVGLISIGRDWGGESAAVEIPGSGAVTLTEAPEGRAATHWAQKRGKLGFTSENGISGTLHLRTDTITLEE